MSTPRFERGDIVNALTPHAGGGSSYHPALVVGDPVENSNGDYILVQITSTEWRGRTDFYLPDSHAEFKATGLRNSSTFRCHKVFPLASTCVQRKFGRAGAEIMKAVEERLRIALGL